jgi:hypothetical protein
MGCLSTLTGAFAVLGGKQAGADATQIHGHRIRVAAKVVPSGLAQIRWARPVINSSEIRMDAGSSRVFAPESFACGSLCIEACRLFRD